MSSSGRGRIAGPLVAALPLALLAAGCLVSPLEETELLRLRLELPPAGERAATASFSPWDPQGLFHLDRFPKLVRVAVESQDYELRTGTWPDPQLGIGAGEAADGAVGVELLVPAGSGRRLRALGYLLGLDGEVHVYREEAPLALSLVAGQASEATLPMAGHPGGLVELTVRCETGTQEAWQPFEVSLVDAKALVIHPARQLLADGNGALKVTIAAPVGRPHWTRLTLRNTSLGQLTTLDVRKPTYVVGVAGETAVVDLPIPCAF
jgi:hypothetical protein